jgi:hypothetical protein
MRRAWWVSLAILLLAVLVLVLVWLWLATEEPRSPDPPARSATASVPSDPAAPPEVEPAAVVRSEAQSAPGEVAGDARAREEPVHLVLRSNDTGLVFAGTMHVIYVPDGAEGECTRTVAVPPSGEFDVPIPHRACLRSATMEPTATGLGWRNGFETTEWSFGDQVIYLYGGYRRVLWLNRTFTLSGLVIDAATHEPVAEAEITCQGHQQRNTLLSRVTTDASGHFRTRFVPQSVAETAITAELRVFHRDYLVATRAIPEPIASDEVASVVIALERGVHVCGRVLDAHGVPVAGVPLTLLRYGPDQQTIGNCLAFCSTTTSHEGGAFELAAVEPGTGMQLRTEGPEHPCVRLRDLDCRKDVDDLVVTLPPTVEFEITLLDPSGKVVTVESREVAYRASSDATYTSAALRFAGAANVAYEVIAMAGSSDGRGSVFTGSTTVASAAVGRITPVTLVLSTPRAPRHDSFPLVLVDIETGRPVGLESAFMIATGLSTVRAGPIGEDFRVVLGLGSTRMRFEVAGYAPLSIETFGGLGPHPEAAIKLRRRAEPTR